jgi:hypothetical protein
MVWTHQLSRAEIKRGDRRKLAFIEADRFSVDTFEYNLDILQVKI